MTGQSAGSARRGAASRFAQSDAIAAAALLAATAAALLWANLPGDSYRTFWDTPFALRVGGAEFELDLQHWVNDALMALFFFLISLEVKRDIVLGEFRDSRRVRVPLVAAAAGLAVPAAVFVLIASLTQQPGEARAAWGVVISTDTAFVLGLVAVAGSALPVNLRSFVLTLSVVDDVAALAVIALVYTDELRLLPLAAAAACLGAVAVMRRLEVWRGAAYAVVAVAVWVGVLASGVHPTVAGVAVGLLLPVHGAVAARVGAAEDDARSYGQSPTTARAHRAALSLSRSVSLNERLQRLFRPWVNLAIVPVFALANAGVRVDVQSLADAAASGLTQAIVGGLVLGKVVGVAGSAVLAVRFGLGRLPSGLFGRHVLVAGLVSGVGFTISLFIVDLALTDPALQSQARIGVLVASCASAALTLAAVPAIRALDRSRLPSSQGLVRPVAAVRDHVRGTPGAPLEIVVYASFAFSAAGRAVEVVEELRDRLGESLVFVFRHLPSGDGAAHAAAQASEAAAEQHRFWPMHDALAARAGQLDLRAVRRCAVDAGLNLPRIDEELADRRHAGRVAEDVRDAEAMGLDEPPRFFVNGQLYDGPLEADAVGIALFCTAGGRQPVTVEPVTSA